ncbi:hypothetical protein HaLaN_07536, partial [Haematococcus lacustris]
MNSCDFAPCEARRTSTLSHTVVSGTCKAQQQSEHVLLLACGRDDGSRDDWILSELLLALVPHAYVTCLPLPAVAAAEGVHQQAQPVPRSHVHPSNC